ncbi:MAG: carboxypeptidase regulatory-like domain-containing protein [Bacteroidota bacterium]
MTRTLRYLLFIVLTALSGSSFAQEIAGKVVDDKKEPLLSAAVQVYSGGILKGGTITDYDGNYVVKPLEPGTYDVVVIYAGYDSFTTKGIPVTSGNRTSINVTMRRPVTGKVLAGVTITYKKPIVNIDRPGGTLMTRGEITKVATTDIKDVVALTPALYQQKRGTDVSIGGARTTGTLYVIDGVQVQGQAGVGMSQNGVEQVEVITSGISAKYGDVSGGVVNMTSRNVSQKMTGNIRAQHSIDGYNNNMLSFSLAGPIYKKRIDSVRKKPVLGFSLSGDYYYDNNRYPTYDKQYTVKADVLKRLLENPLTIVTDNTGFPTYNYSSNYVTFNDLEQTKIPPNNRVREGRLNGKLDYQLTDNMRIMGGGMIDYLKTDLYSRTRSLLAAAGTPVDNTFTGRAYLRFTQKFGKANDTAKGIISNAFYTVQGDYQRTSQEIEDPKFGNNIFKYNYVGKFTENRTYVYAANQLDSASGRRATVLSFNPVTSIDFNRSETNPYLANYTTQYYNAVGGSFGVTSIENQIQGVALANGDYPRSTYSFNGVGLFSSPGAPQNYYLNNKSDQYALSVDASFDLLAGKTRHAIEFGMYYQQRIQRRYVAQMNFGGNNSVWSLMRGLVSGVGNNKLKLDKTKPTFIVNGTKYSYVADPNNAGQGTFYDPAGNIANIIPSPTDTVIYNYVNTDQGTFDRNLRKKMGLKDNDIINIDAVDPSMLSLDMFSADELLNFSGNPYVTYYGYTYAGQKQTGQVNFNDFWTQKDKNGDYTRPIAPFSPNYIAGYILDRFDYKDVHFNVGLRVDRYSANTKTLIDPFSLYPVRTVNQVAGTNNLVNGGAHPANIGSDYVVYVSDNNAANPIITGYRSGNNWFDPTGKLIEDPSTLKQYSNGRDPQPYIVKNAAGGITKMSDSSFNPNLSFSDYEPQVAVTPRLQFSFPISDVANFYAHYDIYAQRPTSGIIANAFDYYQMSVAAPTSEINNANLRMQKTFDYEVGFQQKLTENTGLTITGFYKERKDMIALRTYVNAYPYTYTSFGNRDFSTTKGATMLYDMRATNHLSLNVAYTLQFAEGTGSTPNGGKGLLSSLIQEGFPNIRYVTPLNTDSRHIINANIDYTLGDGEGPVIRGLNAFQNAGVTFIVRTRSGEPYTRYQDALGQTVVGGVNGSRLPWHFNTDMRVFKDFALSWGNKRPLSEEGVRPKTRYFIRAVVMVNNLFNTREILGVYGYTGRPDDNGYLASALGQTFVPQQISPQSYTDLYRIYANNPDNLNFARTINFSLEFNF